MSSKTASSKFKSPPVDSRHQLLGIALLAFDALEDITGTELRAYFSETKDHQTIIRFLTSGNIRLRAMAIFVISESHPVTDVFLEAVLKFGRCCDTTSLYYIVQYLTNLKADDDAATKFIADTVHTESLFARSAFLTYFLYVPKKSLVHIARRVANEETGTALDLLHASLNGRLKPIETEQGYEKFEFQRTVRSVRLLSIAFLLRQGKSIGEIQDLKLPEDSGLLEVLKSSKYVLRKFPKDITENFLRTSILR